MSTLLIIIIVISAPVLAFVGFVLVEFYRAARAFKPNGWTTFQMIRGMMRETWGRRKRGKNG